MCEIENASTKPIIVLGFMELRAVYGEQAYARGDRKDTFRAYMDLTEFYHDLGGNPRGASLHRTEAACVENHPVCIAECGMVEVEVRLLSKLRKVTSVPEHVMRPLDGLACLEALPYMEALPSTHRVFPSRSNLESSDGFDPAHGIAEVEVRFHRVVRQSVPDTEARS